MGSRCNVCIGIQPWLLPTAFTAHCRQLPIFVPIRPYTLSPFAPVSVLMGASLSAWILLD